MTHLKQVAVIEKTINQFKAEIDCLRAEIKRREREIARIHKVANDIQQRNPDIWKSSGGACDGNVGIV